MSASIAKTRTKRRTSSSSNGHLVDAKHFVASSLALVGFFAFCFSLSYVVKGDINGEQSVAYASTEQIKPVWKRVQSSSIGVKFDIPSSFEYSDDGTQILIYTSKDRKSLNYPEATVVRGGPAQKELTWTENSRQMTGHTSSETKRSVVVADYATDLESIAKKFVVLSKDSDSSIIMYSYTNPSRDKTMQKIADTLAENTNTVVEFK